MSTLEVKGIQAPAGYRLTMPAGHILQTKTVTKTDTFVNTASGDVDITGLSVTFDSNLASTSSKVLIMVNLSCGGTTLGNQAIKLYRASTQIGLGDAAGSAVRAMFEPSSRVYSGNEGWTASGHFQDSPSSTTPQAYKLVVYRPDGTGPFYINRSTSGAETTDDARSISSITIMEVAG